MRACGFSLTVFFIFWKMSVGFGWLVKEEVVVVANVQCKIAPKRLIFPGLIA